ncbi:MAG: hypothetical protein ACO1N9_14185 [Flavobacterium sp.]
MKKILLLLCVIVMAVACVPDDGDNLKFHVEFIPVESVQLPESITPGNNYEIKVNFRRPDDCHYFDGFYYEANGSVRVVAVQTLFIEDASCAPIETEEPESESFILQCPINFPYDSYTFKFYQGEDAQGNQQFLEFEVPVME